MLVRFRDVAVVVRRRTESSERQRGRSAARHAHPQRACTRTDRGAGQRGVGYAIESIGRVERMTASAGPATTSGRRSQDPAYRDAVVDLLGAIAYGEISAFERLAEDAKLAPTLEDKVALAAMASAEFGHVARLRERIVELGADPFAAMAPFRRRRSTTFHAHTAPADWFEGLIKAYVGDGLAADFYREIAAYLDADTRDLIVASLEDAGHADVRRRPGPRRDRGGPAARRPAGAVGPAADGGGAHPGAAGRRRARRAVRAAGRRRRPSRARPGRDRPDVHPDHRAARRADGRARPGS